MMGFKRALDTASQHPVCLLALGISPLIMKSETVFSAITVCFAFSLVLSVSSFSVSALRKMIPEQTQLVFILVITATWTTVIDLLMQVLFYEMRLMMDIYIPLIAMNSLLLMVLQTSAMQSSLSITFKGLLIPLCMVLLLCLCGGAMREILAHGSLFSDYGLLVSSFTGDGLRLLPVTIPLPLFSRSAGAFIILGCIIAGINRLAGGNRNSAAG